MKLAKLTALQSLNQNRITEKALLRKNSLSSHSEIVPSAVVKRWENGFADKQAHSLMVIECYNKAGFNYSIGPCESYHNDDYQTALSNNQPFHFAVCCDNGIHSSNVKNARSAK